MSNMKTYTEERGKEPFDWNKALAEVKPEDSERLAELVNLADGWVTCACGNLCDALPRTLSGAPEDRKLAAFGEIFAEDLSWAMDFSDDGMISKAKDMLEEAKETLLLIEARAAKLLKELQ